MVQRIAFVSEEILLVRFASSREEETYWTMLDVRGDILILPRQLKRLLNRTNWTKIESQLNIKGSLQLLLTSDRKLATVSFNSRGEMIELVEFDLTELPQFDEQKYQTFQCNFANELYRICVIETQQQQSELDESLV